MPGPLPGSGRKRSGRQRRNRQKPHIGGFCGFSGCAKWAAALVKVGDELVGPFCPDHAEEWITSYRKGKETDE